MTLDRDQLLWIGEPTHGPDDHRIIAADLVTGARQFTRAMPLAFGEPRTQGLVFADYLALVDDRRGVVLVRRSDGVVRTTLPLRGPVCALGETLIGLHDDSAVAYDLNDLAAPPRVLGDGLADVIPYWRAIELRSCHRRGTDITLQLGDYLVTLGPTRREVATFGGVRPLVLPLEIGDLVPVIIDTDDGYAPALFALVDGPAPMVRRLEPLIHDGQYWTIEAIDGGWLAAREMSDRIDLLALDIHGAVTGAARVLGVIHRLWPHDLAAGRLWLFGNRVHEGVAPIRVLDIHTLASVGGSAGTLIDLTTEAQAAWLPPPVGQLEPPEPPALAVGPPPPPMSRRFVAPPWPLAPVVARAHALGHTGEFELLAWTSDSVLLVAHDVGPDGPRWSFVALGLNAEGVWSEAFEQRGRGVSVFHRRPTRTDVETQLQAMDLSTDLGRTNGTGDTHPSQIDARVYLEVTGRPPRWRTEPAPTPLPEDPREE